MQWATTAGLWVVLTGRAKGGPAGHVLNNSTLASEMVAMWAGLAARYAQTDGIAGYEVLSEPRTDDAAQIHAFQVKACNAVWKHDSRASCLIGAGPFYSRYNVDQRYIIEGNVIYAANYLTPKPFTRDRLGGVVYPGAKVRCGDLVEKEEVPYACPNGNKDAAITFDKSFLRTLAAPFFDFTEKYNVPLWVDQWGLYGAAGGGGASVSAYMVRCVRLLIVVHRVLLLLLSFPSPPLNLANPCWSLLVHVLTSCIYE